MSKKFAAFDMDGTLFRSGLYREVIYDLLATGGAPDGLQEAFTDLEADWKARKHQNAFKDFEVGMANAFDNLLSQVKISDFEEASARVLDRLSGNVYVYTRDLARDLKAQGYTLIAISGSQEELVRPFAAKYGFDIVVAQHYERGADGYFTGEIIKTHDGKDKILQRLATEHNLSFEGSVAVGDSTGDIGMLSIVEQPIAFNPENRLFDAAKAHGWKVVVERKNMIYKLEADGNTFVLA